MYLFKEIWYRYLGDKIKNELRNEKSDPVVLARKRKSTDGSPRSPKVRAAMQRGIVNWAPPALDGEDETTCKAHITWMKKERRKRQLANQTIVGKKMELTFSFRRKMINQEKLLLKSIQEMYPFLFERKQVCSSYIQNLTLSLPDFWDLST